MGLVLWILSGFSCVPAGMEGSAAWRNVFLSTVFMLFSGGWPVRRRERALSIRSEAACFCPDFCDSDPVCICHVLGDPPAKKIFIPVFSTFGISQIMLIPYLV